MAQNLTVGIAGGNKTVASITIRTASGNKAVSEGWIGTAGGNQQFFAGLAGLATVVADWIFVDPVYSAAVQVIASGGTGSYTYLWSITSGGAGVTLETPTDAECGMHCDTNPTTTLVCAVSDGVTTVNSNSVTVG